MIFFSLSKYGLDDSKRFNQLMCLIVFSIMRLETREIMLKEDFRSR